MGYGGPHSDTYETADLCPGRWDDKEVPAISWCLANNSSARGHATSSSHPDSDSVGHNCVAAGSRSKGLYSGLISSNQSPPGD